MTVNDAVAPATLMTASSLMPSSAASG